MASNYIFLENNGTIIPDTSDIKETVQGEYQAALGEDLSLEDSTPQGRLIDIETNARADVIENNALIANSINFNLAFGIILDAWGANFDLIRGVAQSSSVVATVTGVAGTVISAGSKASTQAGDVFYAENQITIGDDGTATATFLSSVKGAIPCPVRSLTVIVDGTLGWETITNLSPAVLGNTKESDGSFKQQFYDAGLFTGMSLIEDYNNAVMSVENVLSARIIDNGENTPKVVDENVTIPAHSVYACVDGGADNDIANALFTRKSGGAGWTALTGQSVTVDVVDTTYGDTYEVIFNRPEEIQVYTTITLNSGNNTADTLSDDVANTINNFINTHKIGEGVSILQVAQAVNSGVQGVSLESIQIGTSAGSLSPSNISVYLNQVVKSQLTNITVTING